MGRQRGGRRTEGRGPRSGGTGPAEGAYEIDTGMCELEVDPFDPQSWIVKINGEPSSHIDLADSESLAFDYMRWIAELARSQWASTAKLRVLHLGGGACTLARAFASMYPDARQVVVEVDGRLAVLVREWFDLPRAPLLRVRVGEARAVTEALLDDSRDLVIRDVFAGRTTPQSLTTLEFTRQARRVLAPGGIYVVNCGDTPDLRGARAEAATIGAVFEHTAIIADPAMLKGKRNGNVVIAGSDVPIGTSSTLASRLLGGGTPAHVRQDAQVRTFAESAKVLRDEASPTAE
ncbi:fused MFS/spermidine synthase [Rhodococcus sp. ABRD24]|uniref:spermidine synthase n=1 Tax=Rhodococcus sp. ABRD24 TaxID=2507582 RepID=UPI0013F15A3F|nr:fused MFS/spermidine synthase [Rhodococcus sp. ABRD24]